MKFTVVEGLPCQKRLFHFQKSCQTCPQRYWERSESWVITGHGSCSSKVGGSGTTHQHVDAAMGVCQFAKLLFVALMNGLRGFNFPSAELMFYIFFLLFYHFHDQI